MDEREEARKLQDAADAEARQHVDADAEISRPSDGGIDVGDAEDDPAYDTDGDERSVASAPAVGLTGLDGETELNGWQELTWPGGILYRGYWRESNMHGKGMLKSDAGIFSGNFIMHKICGTGRYDFNDGSIYIGEFHDNHFQGQGILGYDEQVAFEGEFFEGWRHGDGTMVFENGDIYEGGWYEGKRTGRDGQSCDGTYVAHKGKEVYQGGFLDNRRHGNGSLWIASGTGETWSGEFKRQAVLYKMGKLTKNRARPSCRPAWPKRNPLVALAKARAANANWGAGAGEESERPFSAGAVIAKAKNLNQIVEDEDEENEHDDNATVASGGNAIQEDEDEENDEDDQGSRKKLAGGEKDDADTCEHHKKGMLAKVLGGCFPWLDRSAEDLERDLDKASTFEGKPNAIVIVKVEKCVHLPPMVNNETSNPFIQIKSRGKRQETQIVRETLDPLFEETFDMDHNTNDQVRGIELIVYHSKFGGGKQFLGKLIVDLSGTKMGDMIKMKAWELKAEDGTTPVTCKDPGDGRTVTSNIFISWNISLKPEALVSIRVSNARNINSPDSRGLGFPFIKIKFDDRVLKSQAATELEHPRWDQSISFNTLSIEQLQILPTHARPSPKMRIEVWDSKAIGDDIFIGSCETDISKVRYETRSEMEWNRLSDKTRARRANVGDIKFSVAWGPNEPTILTVQIEEGYALTKHLASSLLTQGRKAKSFFSQEKPEEKKDTLPSSFLKFSLDSTRKRKTKVIKDSVAPKWDEKHHFQVLQSELPTSMLVQCYHSHLLGEELIGMVSVDLQMLELNRSAFVRWYRLQDVELKALSDRKKRAMEKAKQKEKAMLDGTYKASIEEEEDEDLIMDEEDEELTSHLHKQKGGFLSRMSGVNSDKARRLTLVRALNAGKNPDELGRVRIRLTWTSIDDDEEKACQAIWVERLKNPRKKKLMKKIMKSWVSEYQHRGFEVLKRQAAIQRRMEEEALARYRESTVPRYFALWQVHLKTLRLAVTCAYHYNLRCRQKPFFEAWVFEIDKSHKREKIKLGLYPGDPNDLPIQAPLEMFTLVGSDFLDPKLAEKDRAAMAEVSSNKRARATSSVVGSMAGALRTQTKSAGAQM